MMIRSLTILTIALAACADADRSAAGPVDPAARVGTISHGEVVDLADHVAAEGWTVFEYTADW